MHEFIMNEEIHESIYEYCEKIYETICYNNNNCNDDVEFLKADLNNFIENEIEKMSQYDINNILMSYGIDNAYRHYIKNNRYYYNDSEGSNDSNDGISKLMVRYLIRSSFNII